MYCSDFNFRMSAAATGIHEENRSNNERSFYKSNY